MPSNRVQINHSSDLTYEIPDSKMSQIVQLLSEFDTSPTNEAKLKALKADKTENTDV